MPYITKLLQYLCYPQHQKLASLQDLRDEFKIGTLVGEDKYGNRYYENNDYFIGCNRWIEYADHVRLEYDASQVPVKWYGWLHYKTDLLPYKDSNH